MTSIIRHTIGFDKIKKNFFQLNKYNNLGHAYLFIGQEMIGKRTFALELIKKLNSIDGELPHPDVFYISEDNAAISIDQIRDLKKFISLKPYIGPYKFAIIDNAHNITQEAGNSILKVLEEPPVNSILILISSQLRQIIPTVKSRCQIVKFQPHSKEILRKYFEGLKLNKEQVEFLVEFSNGRIGLAARLHENDSFPLIKKIIEDFNKLIKQPLYQRFDFIAKLLDDKIGYDVKTALIYWMLYLRSPISKNIKLPRPQILKKLSKLNYYLSQPQFNHRLLFENAFINL